MIQGENKMTQTKAQNYQVERRQKLIKVPHEGAVLSVVHPPEGPGTYTNTGKAVLARNLALITAEELASLIHAVYCGPKEFINQPEVGNVRGIMDSSWLWVPSRRLWTPNGVYVVQDKEAIGLSQPLDADALEERLKGSEELANGVRFSPDGSIRFAPKESYKLEEHTPESLEKDGSIIAEYGLDGAEKLGEISTKFRNSPNVYGLNVKKGQSSEQRVSALYSGWDGRGLGVDGDLRGNYRCGYVFGVREKTGKASAPEK